MERNFSQRVRNVLGYSREEAARLQIAKPELQAMLERGYADYGN